MSFAGRRVLSLVLALELFCAPAAMAQANAAWDEETPLVPVMDGEELPAVEEDTSGGGAADPLWNGSQDPGELHTFTYGVFSYGLPWAAREDAPARFDGYLGSEVSTGVWTTALHDETVDKSGAKGRLELPAVGRVPDMKFEGFYAYNVMDELAEAAKIGVDDIDAGYDYERAWYKLTGPNANTMRNWSYDKLTAPYYYLGEAGTTVDIEGAYGDDLKADDYNDRYGRLYLPVVGRWTKSDRAEVLTMAFSSSDGTDTNQIDRVYTADIGHKNVADAAADVLLMEDFMTSSKNGEVWLRVGEEQTSFTMTFEAYEPYFDYLQQFITQEGWTTPAATADRPVTVRAVFGDKAAEVPVTSITGEVLPKAAWNQLNGMWLRKNSVSDPARSRWQVEVPLTPAQGDDDLLTANDPFTTITLTLTSPDGSRSQSFVIHVERMAQPTYALGAGNTPYGMIERDTSGLWSEQLSYRDLAGNEVYYAQSYYDKYTYTDEAGNEYIDIVGANKAYAKDQFTRMGSFGAMVYTPQDQSGNIYKGSYPAAAWGTKVTDVNYDLDERAVVVYQDSAFQDPGVRFTDSEGNGVRFGVGAPSKPYDYVNCVTRSIQLRRADALTVDLYRTGRGTACWYDGAGGLTDTPTATPLKNNNGSDQVDLRGAKVLPGVYTIEYTFTDPVNGAVTTATRPLIVLPLPGDVDMDGAVTAADAVTLRDNMAAWGASDDAVARLMRYRTFDLIHDGLLNQDDVDAILKGFQPTLISSRNGSDYMYLPLPEGTGSAGGARERKDWAHLSATGSAGGLTLEYLGVEKGRRSTSGVTASVSGPWKADATQGVSLETASSKNNVFWVGVKLEPGAMAGEKARDFTVTLTYDNSYIKPALVYTSTQLSQMNAAGLTTDQQRWEYMLRYYNMMDGAFATESDGSGGKTEVPKTVWAGTTSDGSARYRFTLSNNMERSYETHYSKVMTDLEVRYIANNRLDTTNLRELVFSIEASSDAAAAALREGYVLVVPFRLESHPSDVLEADGSARMVELSAGMRDFNIVTVAQAQSQTQARSALQSIWSFLTGGAAPQAAAGSSGTAAYSAQDSIYGGVTQNLRELIPCEGGSGLIPMGTDFTTRTTLQNAALGDDGKPIGSTMYDVPFYASGLVPYGGALTGALPKGLTYDKGSMIIYGTPEEAGTFKFQIGNRYYQIIVERRRIRYFADSVDRSYYGEMEYRTSNPPTGADVRSYTYQYFVEDIADRDKTAEALSGAGLTALTGAGTELGALLGKYHFTEPSFVGSVSGRYDLEDDFIQRNTPVGRYYILSKNGPSADNYVFEYVDYTPQGASAGTISIQQRPVRVDHLIVGDTGATLYHDQAASTIPNLTASMAEGDEIVMTLGGPEVDAQGNRLTAPAIVPGDNISITFSGRFIRTAADEAGGTTGFVLHDEWEYRDMEVSNIKLDDASARNYVLMDGTGSGNPTTPVHPESCDVRGRVIRRGVEAIALTTVPQELKGKVMSYGAGISTMTDLWVKIVKGTGSGATEEGSYQYNSSQALDLGLRYNWVSPAEYALGTSEQYRYTLVGSGRYTEADDEKGIRVGDDMRPYGQTVNGAYDPNIRQRTFSPAHTGYRLCVSVAQYGAGLDGRYIKVYSDPITVRPGTISIQATPVSRYYGDENGTLRYTYDPLTLVPADRAKIQSHFNIPACRGQMEELQWLIEESERAYLDENFPDRRDTLSAPVVKGQVSETDTTPVTAATGASAVAYKIIVSGAKSVNYTFTYTSGVGSSLSVSSTYGWADLLVNPRPVVIDQVVRENFATIYADTKKLTVDWDTLKDPAGQDQAPLSLTAGEAVFALPDMQAAYPDRPTYWRAQGDHKSSQASPMIAFSDATIQSGVAVLPGDMSRLEVHYSVSFIPDKGHRNSFTDSYYSIDLFKEGTPDVGLQADGSRRVLVQVDNLELVGEAAGNYMLVFRSDFNAQWLVPSAVVNTVGPNPGQGSDEFAYQVPLMGSGSIPGTGTVVLRPIETLELTQLGLMDYTYGDQFTPNLPQKGASSDTTGLTMTVLYATRYDNDPRNNDHEETVVFKPSRTVGGKSYTTFDDRGFTLGYAYDTDADAKTADAKGQGLDYLEYLVPGKHNGTHLWVKGQRSPQDEVKYSQVTRGTLSVGKKTITLKAEDVHRFYGEGNGSFTFTARAGDLAVPDRQALLPAGSRDTDRVSEALLATLPGYRVPTFTTAADAGSPVGEANWGAYDLNLSVSAAQRNDQWENYTIETEKGFIYVYKRPIQDGELLAGGAIGNGVDSDADRPVYTIFSKVTTARFPTSLGTAAMGDTRATVRVRPSTNQVVTCSDGQDRTLPLSGKALYGSDQIIFRVSVNYYKGTTLPDTAVNDSIETYTEVLSMVESETARNYAFSSTGTQWDSWGAIKIRSIKSIHIQEAPKLEYIYGENLDLSGLQIDITYATQTGTQEQEEHVLVNYMSKEQFESYGLYVNYWNDEDAIPTDDDQRKALVAVDPARTGDHVTIAPNHETQGTAREFKTNGKELIISAFQPGEGQTAVAPLILGRLANGYYEGVPTPIRVYPRQLTYELYAEDKTYDGTGATAGTVKLTNLFKEAGLTDVVYIPLGASYESDSTDYHDFVSADADHDFIHRVSTGTLGGEVSFTTGRYVANGEAPLLRNGYTLWSANGTAGTYVHGQGLTFTFTNPNVHYVDDTFAGGHTPGLGAAMAAYWAASQARNTVTTQWDSYRAVSQMPVVVTNMVLAGPDAANYTWGPSKETRVSTIEVTVSTRQVEENDQAAAPYATIHKANRSTIQTLAGSGLIYPTLAVDIHTNAVRLTHGQDLGRLGNNNNAAGSEDEFREELHFEYALFYKDTDGLYRQWAGQLGTRLYQDTRFFGGEAAQVTVPAAFIPSLDRLLKKPEEESRLADVIYKGQRYGWDGPDSGVSDLGWREDGGFHLDIAAYPGGPENREAYWYYDLYTTDRAPLPRDTVVYPLVRLAETHNYNASGSLSGDGAATAELLDAAVKADQRYEQDGRYLEELQTASAALFAACGDAETPVEGSMNAQAKAQSQAIQDFNQGIGDAGRWPEKGDVPTYTNSGPAVKTYTQRIDMVSAEWIRSDPQQTDDTTEYLVETLEAVWFTDTLVFQDQKYFDPVVYNNPTRYYGYYFDADLSAEVRFTREEYLDLQDLIEDIEIRRRLEDRTTVEDFITVNHDHTIRIFAQIVLEDSMQVRGIELDPSELTATLGDEPVQLGVITRPEKPSNRWYTWTSSDVSVATVDEEGVVTFRGPGTCVITIRTTNFREAKCVVTVLLPEEPAKPDNSLFNKNFTGSFMDLDEAGNFRPKDTMTRGELVVVLDLLCRPSDLWLSDSDPGYTDLTRKERYAEAARRMTAVGVIRGVPGNAFAGEQAATRAEFATMMARLLQLATPDTRGKTHAFLDSGEDATWAYAYIDAVAKAGVMAGAGGERFFPARLITREEVAAVIARLLTVPLSEGQDPTVPADVTPENWAYAAILRAVNAVEFTFPETEGETPAP